LDPITFTFSENSNYWRESLLEVIRRNIAGGSQQIFCFQNVLPLHFKQTFPPIIRIFPSGEGDRTESRLPFKIFFTLIGGHHGGWEVMSRVLASSGWVLDGLWVVNRTLGQLDSQTCLFYKFVVIRCDKMIFQNFKRIGVSLEAHW